jgi:LCP family protein required for cell wall assembly
MTILLMGVDARPGEAIDIGVRADSLMVLHLNARTGSCRLLSIPRDTRTELPGYGMTKINHALAVGGIEYQMQVVELLTGLEMDHYFLIDFNGFQDLVDAVGGIVVNVPEAFVANEGITFEAGRQTFTGQEALSYARWRGGADGDFGRMQRQQEILRALVRKAHSLDIVVSINELLPAVEQNIRTDLSPTQMANVADHYRDTCTGKAITMFQLEGTPAVYHDPMLDLDLYYIEVDEAELRRKVAALIEP